MNDIAKMTEAQKARYKCSVCDAAMTDKGIAWFRTHGDISKPIICPQCQGLHGMIDKYVKAEGGRNLTLNEKKRIVNEFEVNHVRYRNVRSGSGYDARTGMKWVTDEKTGERKQVFVG